MVFSFVFLGFSSGLPGIICESNVIELPVSRQDLLTPHNCPACEEHFFTASDLYGHLSNHLTENGFFCQVCCAHFSSRSLGAKHLMEIHNTGYIAFCKHCSKCFRSSGGLSLHQRLHPAAKSNKSCSVCPVCERYFQTEKHLERHLKSHSTFKPFLCRVCHKSYKHKEGFTAHICRPSNQGGK